jgi:hypothetical protein
MLALMSDVAADAAEEIAAEPATAPTVWREAA